MELTPAYKTYNRNVGRIKSIENGLVLASINAGRAATHNDRANEYVQIPEGACHNFVPQVDDRVFLNIDDDTGEYVLTKLKKTRGN